MTLSTRQTILLVFAAFGTTLGAQVGALPFLVKASAITPFEFGVAGTLAMLANIIAMGLGGWINRHADHRSVLLMIVPVLFVLLGFALLAQSVLAFMASFVLFNFGLGILDIFMNAEASVVEQDVGRSVFSGFHGAASLGVAAFAILGSLVSALLAPWFCLVFAGAMLMLAWGAIYKHVPHRAVRHEDGTRKTTVLPHRVLTFLGLAVGFNVACEVAAIHWAGQLLVTVSPELAAISGLGVAFYGICGGTMRLLGDRLRTRFGDFNLLLPCLFSAIAGFAVLGLSPGFWISVLAFAAVGFGLSITFPCLLSLTGRLVPEGRAAAMSYVLAIGGAPRIVLPWILGVLAAQYSLGAVFAACALVAAVALSIIVLTFRQAQAHALR
ncbi:MAG: hypothetical protein LCH46_08630 [Proteobacteria bacterium]|nr:hypothetical protein [Pseudomonadota bacterium]